MSRKFLTAIDLSKNELQNAAIQNLAAAPSAPVKGQLYFDTVSNTLYWWDGTTWIPAKSGGSIAFGPVVAETTFGGAAADGVATTAARSDHKHANPLHDAAAHSTIPINALAGATGPIDMNGFVISEVGPPVAPTDAANKGYVDNAVAGLSWKDSVRATTTGGNIPLTGLNTVDGVTHVAGDRILLKNQTAPAENGIWIAALGAWTRATDADSATDLLGAAVYVEEGTTMGDTAWVMTTNAPITVGTTGLVWAQFAGGGAVTAGAGMTQSGNTLDVVAGDATLVVTPDAIVRAPLTGDVTTALNAATIAANAVTNTKLADMATATFKGRVTAATGDPEDLTVTQMQTALSILTKFAADGYYTGRFAASCLAATSTVVNHNFNSRDVIVNVFRYSAPYDVVECDIEVTDPNNVTVRFAVAPAAAEYRIVVVGIDV